MGLMVAGDFATVYITTPVKINMAAAAILNFSLKSHTF